MNGMRRDELNRTVCGWLFCGGVSRAGDRLRGQAPWEEKTTVVIYSVKHIRKGQAL